jgi:hypothetical protein
MGPPPGIGPGGNKTHGPHHGRKQAIMDKSDIISIAKDQGLNLAEDTAMAAAKTALSLLRIILPKVSRGFGLAFNLFLDSYEFRIFELLDQIDGKKDAEQ